MVKMCGASMDELKNFTKLQKKIRCLAKLIVRLPFLYGGTTQVVN